jgi:2-oxoglutarate ferredoxin oxidoreductase subunit alpha
MSVIVTKGTPSKKPVKDLSAAVVRFAGDSGDGMQLAGTQFTDTSALAGNDVATLPDFPAEIRAPAGTVAGVSAFQINFAATDIFTPGDQVDALIAMNPAAFKAHVDDVRAGGILVVDDSEFEAGSLKKAGYAEAYNPLDDAKYTQRLHIFRVPITRLTSETLAGSGMGAKDIGRCKNMFALGLIYWLYDRSLETTEHYLNEYFGKKKKLPGVAQANVKALRAGYYLGETAEIFPARYHIPRAKIEPGKYRKITGNEALAMGLITAAQLADKTLVYCSYPITPASDILHYLAGMRRFGVKTFQAEDEIAAICSAIGASYAGQLGVTGTSGPGLALKGEALGLAVVTELPLVVVDVQRGGPSTGLPTKTEQADLFQAVLGRNGDCPLVVLAPRSPAECFDVAIEAAHIALEHMVPVIILSDGYIANGAEPWKLPATDSFQKIHIDHDQKPEEYQPYARDENLVRPWAIPGTPGLEHRIGGLEKAHVKGTVSYDADNHQLMTQLRRGKVEKIADFLPPTKVHGDASGGDLLVVGWGGTYGSIVTAVEHARAKGKKVSFLHMRYLNPMPKDLPGILKRFGKVLVPELNMGQLRMLLRGKYLVDARGLNKVQGKPFLVEEIEQAIDLMLSGEWGEAEYLMPRGGKVGVNGNVMALAGVGVGHDGNGHDEAEG